MEFEKEDIAKDHKFDHKFFPPYLKFFLRTLIEQIFIVFSTIWIHAIIPLRINRTGALRYVAVSQHADDRM